MIAIRFGSGAAMAIVGALGLAACTAQRGAPGAPVVSGTIGEQAITMTATVKAVDHATRTVTLQGATGDPVTFVADEQVRNLPQVDVGDTVVATYYESMAFEVHKPGDAQPGVTMAEKSGRAEPGEKPAALEAQAVTLTTTIEAIDRTTPAVTLKDAEGGITTVKVRNPDNLKKVKVGDLVEITYRRAFAIAVEELP